MKIVRQIGYDLNGWRDAAARNWRLSPGGEVVEEGNFLISGGLGGSVVHVEEESRNRLVGGALAHLAPHGRGAGWGDVGKVERRIPTRLINAEPADHVEELRAALSALGNGADTAVAAINDVPGTGELQQEVYLQVMRQIGNRRALPVWRPVLAALLALKKGLLDDVGKVAIVSQSAKGIAVQVLRIREGPLRSPERRYQGKELPCGFGYDAMYARALQATVPQLPPRMRENDLAAAALPIRLALGLDPVDELFRADNGSWVQLPQPCLDMSDVRVPSELRDILAAADAVLVETLAEGQVREALAFAVRGHCCRPPVVLETDAVAQGALLAAARVSDGEPVYFDFLPQITTIVQDDRGPKPFDLIPGEATLPAGKVYRSETPARLGLQAGQSQIAVFLKKELDDCPRRALVDLPSASSNDEVVGVYIEQIPAQGRAKVMMESRAFHVPIIVDWEAAEMLDQSWEQVLAELETSLPTIPARLVLSATRQLWIDQPDRVGLTTLLREALSTNSPNWKQLAGKVQSREGGAYCISSDGDLPPEITTDQAALLEDIQERAWKETVARARGAIARDNNDALRFLTWLFQRCDRRVIPELLAALDAPVGGHPFVFHHANRRLIYQGLGRILHDADPIRRVFDHLLAIPSEKWKSLNQVSCAAFLLSRTDHAARMLSRHEVEKLSEIAIRTLNEGINEKTLNTLHYPPFLLVGLLRWRIKDRRALVAGTDPVADRMLETVNAALPPLKRIALRRPTMQRLYQALEDVREELKGEGRNPNLLLELATMG